MYQVDSLKYLNRPILKKLVKYEHPSGVSKLKVATLTFVTTSLGDKERKAH